LKGPWHKISAAGKYMGDVSQRKVREWVASGRLKHYRVDGVLYFSVSDMDEFMLSGQQDTPQAEKINAIVDDVIKGLQ
jgi:hypothetical protein